MFLRREVVKKAHHIVAYRWSTLCSPVQHVVMPQCTQEIDAFAMGQRFHAARLPNRRPARLDWRIRTETGLVKKQQLALARMSELIKFTDYACDLAESFRRMLFLKL